MAETTEATPAARRAAWMLALASLVPFVVLAIAVLAAGRGGGWFLFLVDGFKIWSAVTLSFLGGIRWGLGLRDDATAGSGLAAAVLPAIIGWLALFAPDQAGLAVLLLAHCAHGAWDSLSATRRMAPAWFGEMRIVVTLVVAAAHIAVFVAVF